MFKFGASKKSNKQQDAFNETQTIFAATDTMPTEQIEDNQNRDVTIPVRASIAMKKPSIDFNIPGADFLNKKSAPPGSAAGSSSAAGGGGRKGAGKVLWTMATSFKNLVTKKLGGNKNAEGEAAQGAREPKEAVDVKRQFEEAIEQNYVLKEQVEDKTHKFNSFQDQLKQIRLSEEYLERNPQIAQQVILSEGQASAKRPVNEADMFKIADEESDEDDGGERQDKQRNNNEEPQTEQKLLQADANQEGQRTIIDTSEPGVEASPNGAIEKPLEEEKNLDVYDHSMRQAAEQVMQDMAIAKAACEPFIEEEGVEGDQYEIAFDSSTQASSDPSEKPSLTKRLPLKNKERSAMSYHRLPHVGRMQVIEQYECYFKVEVSIPLKQLQQEESLNEGKTETPPEEQKVATPEKKKQTGLLAKMWSLTNLVSGKKSTNEKEIARQKAEEETMVLATRFVTFEEGCILLLQYLPHRPERDYGPFAQRQGERTRPIPSIEWDSQIVQATRLEDLKEIHLINYRLIEQLDDPDEDLVTVVMIFAEVNHDYVAIVDNETIQPLDRRPRVGYKAYSAIQKVQFLLEFDEIEDFVAEVKHQIALNHCATCDLIIN